MASESQGMQEDDMRVDLEAMLKASRELGPEMDRALVNSYLDRQRDAIKQSKAPAPRSTAPSGLMPTGTAPHPLHLVALTLMLAAVVTVVVVTKEAWMLFMLIPLMGMFGGWWGGGHGPYDGSRRQARDEYRRQRWQARADYYRNRYGDGTPEELPRDTAHSRTTDYL